MKRISNICSIGLWQLLIALALFTAVSTLIPRQVSAQCDVHGYLEAYATGVSGEYIERIKLSSEEFPPWHVSDDDVAKSNLCNFAWFGYFANLATGVVGSFSYAQNWEAEYDVWWSAHGESFVRMCTTITVNLPAGDYPDGAPVRLPYRLQYSIYGESWTYLYRQITLWSTVGGVTGDLPVKVYATPAKAVFDKTDVLEIQLLHKGTKLAQPSDQLLVVLVDLRTDAWASSTPGFRTSNVRAAVQFLGPLEVPAGATWKDTSGVFLSRLGDAAENVAVVIALSPVDLSVIDPVGRTIDKDASTIPDAIYTEEDLDGDGDLDDEVTIPDPVLGNYSIQVVDEPGVAATETYTLAVIRGGEITTLAENVKVQDIPTEPYSYFFPQCSVEQGWNLISTPVQLTDNAVHVALRSIIPDYRSVWAYEATDTGGEWKRYIKNAPGFLNTLETIDAGKGYWVLMDDSSILTLDGDEVAVEPIPLRPKWNLVGYNCPKVQLIEEVLPSLPLACNAIWTYSAREGGWERYIMGGSGNNLERMAPGKGYWMHATASDTWNVDGSILAAAPISSMAVEFVRSHVPTDRPGIPYTIWGTIEADGMKMTRNMWSSAPTVILKIGDTVKARYRLGEVAQYGDHYVLDVPEATDGSAQIDLYIQFEDTVTKATSIPPGQPGQIMQLDLSVQLPPKVSLLQQNYPNPFNPDAWIPYQLREDANVVIKIYTATGQLARRLNLGHKSAGFYNDKGRAAYWDGRNEAGEQVSSGIYFYTIQAGDFTATMKMAIAK